MAKRKDVLVAILKALLAGAETSALGKIIATLVAELAALPDDKQEEALANFSEERFSELLNQLKSVKDDTAEALDDNNEIKERLDEVLDLIKNNSEVATKVEAGTSGGIEKSSKGGEFDVFLSHNSKNKPIVKKLAKELKKRGLKVWLDEWELVPGRLWQEAIEEIIQTTRTAAVLVGKDGMGPWEIPEMRACLSEFVRRKLPVIPVLLPEASKKPELPLFLRLFTWVDLRKGLTKEGLDRVEWGIRGKRPSVKEEEQSKPRVFTSKLPVTGSKLFGRDEQLIGLDEAWGDKHCHILSFVAFGGVGKTALVNEWLGRMERKNWDGARRVYGWSFYSQGTKEDRQASGDTFLVHALEWFGDKETAESSKSAWDKGVRLAELIRQEKTLLILDGLEPLQYPPGPMQGRLKDQGLQALLRELCHGMDGLSVISTREKIEDLETHVGHAVKRVELETLTPEAGMEVLRNEGVKGTDKELKQASKEFGGHALALTLLGNYLSVVHKGEIRKRDLMPVLTEDEEKGGHARRVMQFYEDWLEGTAELDILYLMGLFDRPAEMGAIEVLKGRPAIEGLTENLAGLKEAKWKYAIKRLRGLGMLSKQEGEVTLDCHPLVREHFGEKLEKERTDAWREAHSRLYEYYKSQPEKELPDTLEEMEPLFRAVYHGCAAGKYQETFVDVYMERICRGNEAYVDNELGAYGSDLGAVSCFFERLWSRPAEALKDSRKALVLNFAGFALRAVGRLREAVEPNHAGMKLRVKQEFWQGASRASENISELYLTIGEVGKAVEFGERSVEYADRSGETFEKMAMRTVLGDALHQAGQVEKAKELFEEAERMQRQWQPEYQFLSSLQGYQYCDLLLSLGRIDEVKERAREMMEVAKKVGFGLLTQALDKLSLGQALFKEYQKLKIENKEDGSKKALAEAKKWLEAAVAGLREAAHKEFVARGLFARAELYREMGDIEKARGDVAEAREIAERGGMGRWMVDVLLEEGRIYWAMGEKGKARKCGEECKALIERTGYHRRDSEAEELNRR